MALFKLDTYNSHQTIELLGIKFRFKLKQKNCIAIIANNGIGDYLLYQPYLKYLRNHYSNKYIVFFAKGMVFNLLEKYSSNTFDKIINYENNGKYIPNLKKILKEYSFEEVIYLPSLKHNDKNWGNKLMRQLTSKINAKNKWGAVLYDGNSGDLKKVKHLQKYNRLVCCPTNLFESKRYQHFFSKILDKKIIEEITIIKPELDFSKDFILISPVASNNLRRYSLEKWIKIIDYMSQNISDDIQIVFIGGNNDKNYIQEIINHLPNQTKCVNIAGDTSIRILPAILKYCKFLVGVETGTVHMAHAVNCPCICLSSGAYYNRYHPYKEHVTYIYPKKFRELITKNDLEKLKKYYSDYVDLKIDDIEIEDVITEVKKHLNSIKTPKTLVAVERERERERERESNLSD